MDGFNWRELYRAAVLESQMDKLGERAKTAEETIRARTSVDGDIPSGERNALADAVNALALLKWDRR